MFSSTEIILYLYVKWLIMRLLLVMNNRNMSY